MPFDRSPLAPAVKLESLTSPPKLGVNPPGKRLLNAKQLGSASTAASADGSGTSLRIATTGHGVVPGVKSATRIVSTVCPGFNGSGMTGPSFTPPRVFGLRKKKPPSTVRSDQLPNAYACVLSLTSRPTLPKNLKSSRTSGEPHICAGLATAVLPAAISAAASSRCTLRSVGSDLLNSRLKFAKPASVSGRPIFPAYVVLSPSPS